MDLAKIQRFHDCISQNTHYITAASEIGIDRMLGKKMLDLCEAQSRGDQITFCIRRSKVTLAFKLIMEGPSDCELLEKRLTPSDINSAKKLI